MEKPRSKVCWITPDYFFNVDAGIVPTLSEDYFINWIIVKTVGSYLAHDQDVPAMPNREQFDLKFRQRDPRIIREYLRLIDRVRQADADLVYISFHGLPYFMPLFLNLIGTQKVLYAAHNVSTPKGASHEYFMRRYHDYVVQRARFVHVFSKSQLKILLRSKAEQDCFYAPLTLEDHGPSSMNPPTDRIRFLFFGNIKKYKRVDLLINAFNELCRSGVENVELWIAGSCDNWGPYQSMLGGNKRIVPKIGIVPNDCIADLISSCHYVVLPYQDIAQSGVLPLSYKYSRPVIASDLDGFKEFVDEGCTGFLFKTGSEQALYSVMKDVVSRHAATYQALTENVQALAEQEYSVSNIALRYRRFLDYCMRISESDKSRPEENVC